METPLPPPSRNRTDRRKAVNLQRLSIPALVMLLQWPLHLANRLRRESMAVQGGVPPTTARIDVEQAATRAARGAFARESVFDASRLVERSPKHGVLVLSLAFAAFFLFEPLAGLRLHAAHGVLFVVLRMADFALFGALAAVVFLSRNIDWHGQEDLTSAGVEAAR